MRRVLVLIVLSAVILGVASMAAAQDFSRRFTLGLWGGLWKLGLTEHSDIYSVGKSATWFLGYDLKEKFSLGFSAAYAKTWEADLSGKEGGGAGFTLSKKSGGNSYTHVWLDLYLIHGFRSGERLNPYIFSGIGLALWNVKDENGNYVRVPDLNQQLFDLKDQELTFFGGVGIEYRLKERYGLNLGTRFRILSRTFSSFEGPKDIVGGAPDELDLPKGTLEIFLGVNYYFGKLMDSDKDGVPDRVDLCADTPFGALVDEKGCPLDSDGDGIYNGLDRCPATPTGTSVDVNGCPQK